MADGNGGPERRSPGGRAAPILSAAAGACPRCGARTLFDGWSRFAPRCRACGLDIDKFNVGDGPAAFLTLIIGTLVVILAVWLQLAVEPPWWVHVLLWVPLTVAGTIGGLRIAKAMLLQAEYHRGAAEARHRK